MTSRSRWIRIGVLAAIIVAFFVIAEATGLRHRVTLDAIKQAIHKAGPWGILLYVLAFVGLEFLHIPGLLFVIAGVLIWGPIGGGILGGLTALLSLSLTFVIVRAIGGEPTVPQRPAFLKHVFERLQRHPVLTVALLRLVTFMTPTVTYALALSPVRFRQMLIGSAIGLVPVLTLCACKADWLFHRFFG